MKRPELAILPVVALLVAGLISYSRIHPVSQPAPPEQVPDFAAIGNITAKKRDFFAFMLPKVRYANDQVRKERARILELNDKIAAGQALNKAETRALSELVSRYHIIRPGSPDSALKQLLTRVDVVPASLMLAQSATESAWGTSRFARQGNNFFGIWCFTPGCGMTPKYRDEGLTHEVARFDTVQEGVSHYLHTLNTNLAYRDLRNIRAQKRRQHKPVRGIDLAEGLHRYSERGSNYVRDIKAMIRINRLQRFSNAASIQVSENQ